MGVINPAAVLERCSAVSGYVGNALSDTTKGISETDLLDITRLLVEVRYQTVDWVVDR